MGGWNKGFTKETSDIIKKTSEKNIGRKQPEGTSEKLKNRPKEIYKPPQATEYNGDNFCEYGCTQKANFIFKNGKYCCSSSHNSCLKKRLDFSNLPDHKGRAEKSLKTRTELGITKSSREKACKTMHENGTYNVIASKMRKRWEESPWNNQGPRGEWKKYKDTDIGYQSTYELSFLSNLEQKYNIEWIKSNVKRGPSVWYKDPKTNDERLYISDFIIGTTIFEIKSSYTWNRNGKDLDLENLNRAKLNECIAQGFNIVLVLDKREINYAAPMDRKIPATRP
jgi:hypothetical protein